MSDFVTAVHCRTEDQGAVIDALVDLLRRGGYELVPMLAPADSPDEDPTRSRVRQFFVSPSAEGWVSVFDQNFVEIFSLALPLSEQLQAPALLLWCQGQKSWGYSLCESGRRLDEYATDPNYLVGECGGRPEVLCEYGGGSAEQFRRLLAEGRGHPRAAVTVFAKLMGIVGAESDFEDLASGDTSQVESFEEFVPLYFVLRDTAVGGNPLPGIVDPQA